MQKFLYWITRISSGISIGVIAFFFIAHLTGNEFTQVLSMKEGILFLFFPIGVCLGQIIAWDREFIGGIITMISIGVFNLLDGSPYNFSMIDALALPGILFIFSALYNKYK
ncbi:MAG: hypothetical protein HN773_02900 [Flavobacteriaceae bacterium]|mgnify:FL=1|jgi:hypothetical protein|nr:hypothetical protein [Flavobacteriaceae bacterium]MBT4112681.1 hypothetical protein [Flavobacteriaceae bacterium]MBT4614534.1 hypothetical protein [Flavobacteriaceae bacterium]MBT5246987.1 hypothetical protein [Flavobacteriaceae bacterium]MBT5650171.1 hypothetical protein [Flavobacteriaceae bacterium]|tara:strand:- start:184 stop:516 length:333 start_codon:yes stop_codon:yes gene_type:complete